eukprot:g45850.t1
MSYIRQLLVVGLFASVVSEFSSGRRFYTNTWAVHISGGAGEAKRIARKHGFINLGRVKWLEQQIVKRRQKRAFSVPSDPLYRKQWYLNNAIPNDLNVLSAWKWGYTGKGIVVSILDDGIEKNHPDLAKNYDPNASFDINDNDPDPQPRYNFNDEN